MGFYDYIKLLVGDNFLYIEDDKLDTVSNFCDCAGRLCEEIDTEFFGAYYDKDEKVFCISIYINDTTFKKGSMLWGVMNISDGMRLSKIAEIDQFDFTFNQERQVPDIKVEFYICLDK